MDIEKEIINRFIAESIMKALADNPTDITKSQTRAEKSYWLEVYDDEVEEQYKLSQEYREYE